jgi:hypothetical protein
MFKYTAYILSTTLKSITCLTVFKYMGVYEPTVFVKNFKHIYITYTLAGLHTKLSIFETADLLSDCFTRL